MIWDERVNKRLNALYQQLGKEFDKEPFLEAVVIPETAITGDVTTNKELLHTREAYKWLWRAVEEGMQARGMRFRIRS